MTPPCESVGDPPCEGAVAFRGTTWQCDRHWHNTQNRVHAIKKKAADARRRRPRDTE